MNINIGGVDANYRVRGEGGDMLLLHGWGVDSRVFDGVMKEFAASHRVIAPDLPGFGTSGDPTGEWGVGDYTAWVLDFMDALKVTRATVVGHSFGGRIAIKIASDPATAERIGKLVLTGSAGLRRKRPLKGRIRGWMFRTLSRLFPGLREKFARKFASRDYLAASPLMRKCLIKVVTEDLAPLLPDIPHETLLIWGKNDTETPVGDGYTMQSLIPRSRLEVLDNAGHFAFLNRPDDFNRLMKEFLQ
jgi:pimeloyl-ACP methyl ester carboxylesterase